MKLTLAKDTSLETTLDFSFYRKVGNFTIVDNKIATVRNLGVYLSGGLDSAALLCLMLAEYRNKNLDLPITAFTIDKSDGPTYHAVNVLEKIKEHFNIDIEHINNIPNDPDAQIMANIGGEAMKFIRSYKPHMLLYMGINRMAPDDIRPFTEVLKIDYGTAQVSPSYRAPFLFLHKPQILDIFYQLGCEDIIPYTHSCTMMKDDMCGKCYSCQERKWGFDALNKTDPAIGIDI